MINTTISHYRILKQLGEGGMGQVFLAEDTNLGRLVAMKVLTTKHNANPDFLERFKREARAAAKLDHPNIVRIYESDEHNGITYIVMEYVDDGSLRNLIERDKLSIQKVLEIVIQISVGLSVAHERGMVHRDIKPDNIFLSKTGHVKIGDFGIAKLQDTTGLTQAGGAIGTPYYMAPEQFKNQKVDTRADIFSLGVLLWEMLARQRPFTGDTSYAIMFAITQTDPSPLNKFNSDVSRNLQRIVDRCLQKDVNKRYQKVEELLSDLRAEEQSLRFSSDATKTVFITQRPDFKKIFFKQWQRTAILAAAAMVLLVSVYFLLRNTGEDISPVMAKAVLSITTNPVGATVCLNGDSIGTTPLQNYNVAAEETLAVFLRKPGFSAIDTSVVAKSNERFRLALTLQPLAQVTIVVNPVEAQVFIDGQTIASTRLAALLLEAGSHQISVMSAGYEPMNETLVLQKGLNPPQQYNLVKLANVTANAGGLFVTSQPDGATITLNGAFAGKTPYQNRNLKPGRYNLVVRQEGFENYSAVVTVRSGEITPFEAPLQALTVAGRLSIKSDPVGATIFLDGSEVGTTPNDLNNIAAGSHQIALRKKGYKDYVISVTVAPQQLQTVEAPLEMLTGILQVLVKPYGTIYVDDDLKMTNADVRVTMNLTAASHKLKVIHPIYGKFEKDITLDAAVPLNVEIDFNRVLTVKVTADGAEWGNIFVDGEPKGQTPKDLKLRLGLHTIEVRRDGYIALEGPMTINLEENWKQPLKFRLQKKV